MKEFIKNLFRTDVEIEDEEPEVLDEIEVLENKAEEILSVMSYDWKYEVLVNDVIEPMITLLKEQKEKIEELENSSS